jgi:hypothetical protein
MRVLGPLLNRRSGLSIMYGFLLYKQFIRPMMDFTCPFEGSLPASECCQVLQSKCLRLATIASWYVSIRQVHEDVGVPFFADHIRAPTASIDSTLADVRKLLVRQIGRYLRWSRVDFCSLTRKPRATGVSRPVEATAKRWPSRLNASCPALFSWAPFGHSDWGCSVFSSDVRRMPTASSPMCLSTVACFRLATAPVRAQYPERHPTKVYPVYK